MQIRNWQEILSTVVESDHEPEGWRAIAGQRATGVGEDFYLGHPDGGLYQLKTYAKNPTELRGVGTQIARKIDDEIDPLLPRRGDDPGRFAMQQPPADESDAETMATQLESTLQHHAGGEATAEQFFTDVMEAVDSPAFGPMEYELSERPDRLARLSETFDEAETLLNAELDELITDDDVGRGFQ